MDKQFAIYKCNWRLPEHEVWVLHKKYSTAKQCRDSFKDLIRRPKKKRVYVYLPCPTFSKEHKILKFSKEQSEQMFNAAK